MAVTEIATQGWGVLLQGAPLALKQGASVSITIINTTTPATIWTDNARTATIAQPLITRVDGTIPGFLDSGTYIATWTVLGQPPFSHQVDVALGLAGPIGAQGIDGTPGVGAVWKGAWSAATTYALGDGAYRNSLPYVSNVAGNLNHDPSTDTGANWGRINGSYLVNVKEYGAVGDGASRPLSGYFASLAAAQVVYPAATALTQEIDWAAWQKALNALTAGGTCFGPRGTYLINSTLNVPNGVLVIGEGIKGTNLAWTTDLGLGAYAITTNNAGQALAPHFENIALLGPRNTFVPTPGVRSCNMDGMKATQWVHMTECFVSGFGSNVVITGDHQKFKNVRSTRGFFNILFGDNSAIGTTGDQEFGGCTFDFSAWSAVGVYGNNGIVDGTWTSTHVGFSPYSFYKFDVFDSSGMPSTAAAAGGGAVASTLPLLSNTVMRKVSFEAQGNACILDDSTGSVAGSTSLSSCLFDNCVHTWTSAYKIAARARDFAISVRVSYGTVVNSGANGFGAGDVAAYHVPVGDFVVNSGVIANMFSPTTNIAAGVEVRSAKAIARLFQSVTAADVGDIMQKSAGGYQAQRYDGAGQPVLGICAATVGAVTGVVLVYVQGGVVNMSSEVCDVGGQWICPGGGGVLHRGQAVLHFGQPPDGYPEAPITYPAIGISHSSGGASGGGNLPVMLLGPGGVFDPSLVRPKYVTALPTAAATYWGQMLRIEGGGATPDKLYICEYNGAGAYAWRQI